MQTKKAMLVLSDGTRFQGISFGYECGTTGEVVFNTAMTGYGETLVDPAYKGQIIVLTYPLIGNYGVPDFRPPIHTAGLIVGEYSEEYSHWNAEVTLKQWLQENKIPAISGIDTRALTKHLREHGVMSGTIIFGDEQPATAQATAQVFKYDEQLLVPEVTTPILHSVISSSEFPTIVYVECGSSSEITMSLTNRKINVVRVPWDYDFNTLEFDGLVLSSGPGDPRLCEATMRNLRTFLTEEETRPLMGIGLGHQILAKVVGATIHKLPYGHRGHNQPVRMVGTEKCFITHQNHGYVADTATLQEDWVPSFINMNDNTNEGIRHINKPWFSVQFTPDMNLSGEGTAFLMEDFIANLKK